jgi:hypothetical protein
MRTAKSRTALFVLALTCALVSLASSPRRADAEDSGPASFALIIGSNVSVDRDLPTLKYADDDAARYLDLFRLLGARTYLLTRLDDNTRRLHPQAAAEALEPRRATFEKTMTQIGLDVAQARERHLETALYVVYAGHGGVENGEGYITIEDMRITGSDLARYLAPVPATQIHVIADACASYFLAYSRGPGGERRPLHGFQDVPQLANDPRIGLLLSTSSAGESLEWEAFQAGVFSHEVRSGLYGAADADGDGRVSYREIAAFVSRANAAIPNERFRPDVHVKAPSRSDTLLDLRHGLGRRLDLDGAHAGHYRMEDERGVRLLDFHNAPGQSVHLVRPPPTGHVYVRRLDDDAEFTVPASPSVIALADLDSAPPRIASRGAEHEAFSLIFSLPFGSGVVDSYVESSPDEPPPPPPLPRDEVATTPPPGHALRVRRIAAWSAVGLGIAGLGTGAALSVSAIEVSHGTSAASSNQSVASRDERISALNTGAAVAYAGGAVALGAGVAALLFWPSARHVQAVATPHGGYIGYTHSF